MGSTSATTPFPAVLADRGGIVETTHRVHAAVVDARTGALLRGLGDPSLVTLVRSAAKPAQALAILETGAAEKYGFDNADLALMCASHSAEARHVARARAMLAKVGAGEADLAMGGHPSISEAVNARWAREGIVPGPAHNNCSGKHAGMLGAAGALGAGFEGYHLPDHPVQKRVKEVVDALAGEETRWAVDGCNLPTPAGSLTGMARMYGAFARAAEDEADESLRKTLSDRERDMARVFAAMTEFPEMVGGEGRFCTDMMAALGGRVFGKVGADGFYGVGVRGHEGQPSLGIAVKVEDGDLKILYAAVSEILRQLGVADESQMTKLAAHHQVERKNTAGVTVGKLSYSFAI